MQTDLFLCILTMYQILRLTTASEEKKSRSEEYVKLLAGQNEDPNTNKQTIHEIDDNPTNDQVNIYPIQYDTGTESSQRIKEENNQYEVEKKQGDMADLFGTNQHYSYPDSFKDLGRRFVLQYPYKDASNINNEEDEGETQLDNIAKDFLNKNEDENHLIPVKAPPELVLAVAAKAALIEAANRLNPVKEKFIQKEVLRSGNYWNGVWKEDVNPEALRTQQDKTIQSVKVKFDPSSKLYTLVSQLKKISPRLVYVINKQ